MSRPSDDVLEIECINYGFLSVKARQAIEKILIQASLSDEEKLVLKRAHDFLVSVSQGAELISTGSYHHSSNPVDSIKALNLAIDPLEKLQKVVHDTPIAVYFKGSSDFFVGDLQQLLERQGLTYLLESTKAAPRLGLQAKPLRGNARQRGMRRRKLFS